MLDYFIDRYLLAYRSMYNTFFMDFVCHLSLLTAKHVNFVVRHMMVTFLGTFERLLIHTAV